MLDKYEYFLLVKYRVRDFSGVKRKLSLNFIPRPGLKVDWTKNKVKPLACQSQAT